MMSESSREINDVETFGDNKWGLLVSDHINLELSLDDGSGDGIVDHEDAEPILLLVKSNDRKVVYLDAKNCEMIGNQLLHFAEKKRLLPKVGALRQ